MQSAFKHELHNTELIILRYRIPLSVIQLHLGMSTTSLKCHGRHTTHPASDPRVDPIHGPLNTAQPLHASHAQKRAPTPSKWVGIIQQEDGGDQAPCSRYAH